MSTPEATKAETPAAAGAAAGAAPASKGSAVGTILKVVLTALFAAGASYGGARAAAATHTPPPVEHHEESHPPGPTIALEPFLVTIHDANKKSHPMKVTLAVEFEHTQTEEHVKPFAPRIRDAVLAYIRSISFEDATDGSLVDKMRAEILEKCKAAGATGAERVLITDFVIQ